MASWKSRLRAWLMGWSAIRANSAGPISRSATQSGLRTLASGSRDPNARAAAVRIEVREGNPLASIQELLNISALCCTVLEPAKTLRPFGIRPADYQQPRGAAYARRSRVGHARIT